MSTALASVLRPRTSRRLRMRDIHVIYADSNSADFAGFKNRVQTQQERDRQTRLERRRQQERERRARETPEERDRRRSLRNQRDRERRRAARCASALAQLERVCTCACIIIRIRIYIRELAHARPPMSSISLVLGMRTRIFFLAPDMVDVYVRTYHLQTIPVYACVHAYTYTWNSMYACVHVHTRVTFRSESLGSCETILRDRLKRDKSSLARA